MVDAMHTPGPWMAGDVDPFGDITIVPELGGIAVAAIPNGVFMAMGGKGGEHKANAHLIAAAPDLLKTARPFALSDWVEHPTLRDAAADGLTVQVRIVGTSFDTTVTVGEIRALCAAIAKAEGRP